MRNTSTTNGNDVIANCGNTMVKQRQRGDIVLRSERLIWVWHTSTTNDVINKWRMMASQLWNNANGEALFCVRRKGSGSVGCFLHFSKHAIFYSFKKLNEKYELYLSRGFSLILRVCCKSVEMEISIS